MPTDLNLQGNGHHSDTLTHFALSLVTLPVLQFILWSHPYQHMHTRLRSCLCDSVLLWHTSASSSVLQAVLYAKGPISSVWLVWPFQFLLSHCQCYWPALVYSIFLFTANISHSNKRGRQAARIKDLRESGKNTRGEIRYVNLLCSIHPNPQSNKRLSHSSYMKVHQPLLLPGSERWISMGFVFGARCA